tara:strand:+ start:6004 stop:7356 length:1353 start_codon:yes stop_codon:yes gene_type:complete
MRSLLPLLALISIADAARPRFTGAFPWARVPTMCQTHIDGRFVRSGNMTGVGRLDDKVLRFLAENYDLIVAGNLEPGRGGCLEPKIKDFADRIASFNPHARVLVYEANQIHHGALLPPGQKPESQYLCGLDNFKPEWIATWDNGTRATVHGGKNYVTNLSIPAARKWWIDVISNSTMGKNVHGVFADNGLDSAPSFASPARGAALLRGQQALLDEARQAGKYTIFNGIRYAGVRPNGSVRDDYTALDVLLPHASAGYAEPWLSSMYRNTTTGKLNEAYVTHGLLRMINVSREQPTRGITFKSGPGPCVGYVAGLLGCTWPFANGTTKPVPNGWNGTPKTAAAMREAAAKLITFPLATFLCAAGPKWNLDYTWGYEVNHFVPGEKGTHALAGQPNLASYAPDDWYPDLLKAPGTPLEECEFDEKTSTFRREWSGVSVSLNVRNETAVIHWK